MDKVEGYLEVGTNENGEIVVNHPDLKPDENGVGHIVFSPNQARHLAYLLNKRAGQAELDQRRRAEEEKRREAEAIPVDRSARVLLNGQPESAVPDYREPDASGMQKSYVVLTPEERAKGFVRPVRRSYVHKPCGTVTTMSVAIAETYARDPKFYSGTFCVGCRSHYPLDQFVWEGTSKTLGS